MVKSGAVLLLVVFGSYCFAQEKENEDSLKYELQEVVVVGTRTVEKIIDIPYSVFRVDRKELSFGKKVSAKDVLADVPGLLLQSRYGNHDLRISIRGFGTRSNSGVRGVRILQDGIPESEPDGETVIDAIDLTSLGGVEVVKSNLSSLYANAPGGVINFVSDIYFPENYFAVTNQVGRFGLRQHGFKTGYRTNDYRFFITYNYRNLNGYRRHSDEYQNLINTVYEGHLGVRSVITLLANYVNGLIKLPGPLTKAEFDQDPFQADPHAVSQDFRRNTKKGRLGVRFKTFFGESDNYELEVTGYGGIKELEKADKQYITLATRYSLGSLIRFTTKSQILQRTNVISVGMDYANQSGPVNEFKNLAGVRDISVAKDYNGSLNNIGFYFLDHYNLVREKFDIFVSGRFDRNVFSRDIFIPSDLIDTSRVFENFAPKIGLNYKLTPSVALYTSYGLSYDYPALSELDDNRPQVNKRYVLNPDLDPQQSNNFELGLKGDIVNPGSEFLRKLFFEATFFNYLIRREIVPFIIDQETYFRTAARTNRTGVEIGVKSKPFEGVEFTTNYTFTNFRYTQYTATVYDPSGPPTTERFTNNIVPSVPKHIVNLILNYEFEVTKNISTLLQWDCDFMSSMQVNDGNTESTPAYFYANPMVGMTLTVSPFNAVAYFGVNNIFDRRYAGFININDYKGTYYECGEPMNIYGGLNLSVQF